MRFPPFVAAYSAQNVVWSQLSRILSYWVYSYSPRAWCQSRHLTSFRNPFRFISKDRSSQPICSSPSEVGLTQMKSFRSWFQITSSVSGSQYFKRRLTRLPWWWVGPSGPKRYPSLCQACLLSLEGERVYRWLHLTNCVNYQVWPHTVWCLLQFKALVLAFFPPIF